MKHFTNPFLLNVVQRIGRVDGETDQDDVRIGIRQRTKSIIIFLSSGIPQRQLDSLSIYYDIGDAIMIGIWARESVQVRRIHTKVFRDGERWVRRMRVNSNNGNSLVLEDGRNVNLFSSTCISTGCISIEMWECVPLGKYPLRRR